MRGEHAAIAAALFEWGRTLPALARRREMLQQSRTRSEHDIVTAFPDHWLDPIPVEPTRQPEYNTVHRAVIAMFGLRRFLPRA